MTITKGDIRYALDKLGHTPRTIALRLRKQGVTGITEDGETCAIAVYLQEQFPDEDVSVCIGKDSPIKVGGIAIKPPPVVRQFVTDFDEGVYPALIEHHSGCDGTPIRSDSTYVDYVITVTCYCGNLHKAFEMDERAQATRYVAACKRAVA